MTFGPVKRLVWLSMAIGVDIGKFALLQFQFDVCKLIQCFLWLFLLSRLSSRAPSSWSRSFEIESCQNHYHHHDKKIIFIIMINKIIIIIMMKINFHKGAQVLIKVLGSLWI